MSPEQVAAIRSWQEVKDNFTLDQVTKALYWMAKNREYHKKYSLKQAAILEKAKAAGITE